MWANAQRGGRPAEHRWRPLFHAAKFGWRTMTGPFLLHMSVFIFSLFIVLFCLVPCGRFSWLYVSFWAHVNIIVSFRVVSYRITGLCNCVVNRNLGVTDKRRLIYKSSILIQTWGRGLDPYFISLSFSAVCRCPNNCFYRQHCAKCNAPVFKLLGGRFWGFFAPQGRHVAPMGVKFGTPCQMPNFTP